MDDFRRFWREVNDSGNAWRNIIFLIVSGIVVSRIDGWFTEVDVNWSSKTIPRILLALLVVIAMWRIFRVLRGGEPLVFREIEETPGMPALVAFVSASSGRTPAQSAIEFQKAKGVIRYCSLLYTEDSKDNTEEILRMHPNTTGFTIQTILIEDDRNPDHVYAQVCAAIDAARRFDRVNRDDEVLVDFTGGTKLATFAMAMAAQDTGASVQYIYTPFDRSSKRLDFSQSTPMLLHAIEESSLRREANAEAQE